MSQKKKVLCIGAGGLGDSLTSLQCAFFAQQIHGKDEVDVIQCVRDEIFKPLKYLFEDQFIIFQHPQKEEIAKDYALIKNPDLISEYRDLYEEIYFDLPDLVFRHPLSFNCDKYKITPRIIREKRLLLHKWNPTKRIFMGLCSSTDGYHYGDINGLMKRIALNIRDRQIYFPKISVWGGRDDLDQYYGILEDLGPNVYIHDNPDFCEALECLCASEYGIYTDCGTHHIAYHLGQPRIVFDPQWEKAPWMARWRPSMDEYIPINISVEKVVDLAMANIYEPETRLLPHLKILKILQKNSGGFTNWRNELIYKF